MRACASVSGGVMFIPDSVERTIPKIVKRLSNDNARKKKKRTKP